MRTKATAGIQVFLGAPRSVRQAAARGLEVTAVRARHGGSHPDLLGATGNILAQTPSASGLFLDSLAVSADGRILLGACDSLAVFMDVFHRRVATVRAHQAESAAAPELPPRVC